MLVVSNTSPILNLAIIGRLDVLRQQFETVWAPTLRESMDQLRDLAGFRIGAPLYDQLLQAATSKAEE